ncbi:MAG: hypothetical protein ACUVSX_00350 [Aggregatilineales bacterium]
MSIFTDDWRACLREHYMYVVRTGDRVTLPSLTLVMHEIGFTDDDLAELRVLATMRADDMPPDYVPPEIAAPRAFPAAALDETEAAALPVEDDEPEPEPESDGGTSADDPDAPQQLSLF